MTQEGMAERCIDSMKACHMCKHEQIKKSVRKNKAHIKREKRGVSLGEKGSSTHICTACSKEYYLCLSLDLIFDLAIYEKQICLRFYLWQRIL